MIKELALLIYVVVFLLYIAIKSLIFYKNYRINPAPFLKIKSKEAAYWWLIVIVFLVYGTLIILNYLGIFGSIFNNFVLDLAGFIVLLIGFITLILAHAQMGKSWRMGLDNKVKTKLVSNGLFSYSRNPVYLGLFIQAFAILLLIPNIPTLILFILLLLDINFIVRSEEKFLEKQFGKEYLNYKKKVRRFI